MKSAYQAVKQFVVSEDGPTAVEYAVVVALIIIACILAITGFGTALSGWFTDTSTTVDTLPTGPAAAS
jgi:pilus assembly protein Flp/PilA